AAAETVLAVDPEEEIAVQTVETDPLGIYPSSDSSDDSDFDALNNDVNDGVLLDEDEWTMSCSFRTWAPRRTARTAAFSSKRGMVMNFSGAILDFEMRNLTSADPSG
ncbi:hypothetical protein DAPPUDRAFT_270780, partial [Daphnia pulex]